MKPCLVITAIRPIRLIATAASCFVGAACGEVAQKQAAVTTHDTALAETSVTSSHSDQTKSAVMSGPRIVSDSLVGEPGVETTGTEFVVHMPTAMNRLLFDSLPEFSPQPQSFYSAGLVGVRKSPMSVVTGDFDGDSKRDIAMIGTSRNTPAFIMLLARSEGHPGPRLLIVDRPDPNTPTSLGSNYLEFVGPKRIQNPDDKKVVLDLRTDAVAVIATNYAEIVYLDHGVVRRFSQTGD